MSGVTVLPAAETRVLNHKITNSQSALCKNNKKVYPFLTKMDPNFAFRRWGRMREGKRRGVCRRWEWLVSASVQNWFLPRPLFLVQYRTPLSPLQPNWSVFLAWWWKFYNLQPYVRMSLTRVMKDEGDQIDEGSIQGWIPHSTSFLPCCHVRDNIKTQTIMTRSRHTYLFLIHVFSFCFIFFSIYAFAVFLFV